jgi:hypothetical protein
VVEKGNWSSLQLLPGEEDKGRLGQTPGQCWKCRLSIRHLEGGTGELWQVWGRSMPGSVLLVGMVIQQARATGAKGWTAQRSPGSRLPGSGTGPYDAGS